MLASKNKWEKRPEFSTKQKIKNYVAAPRPETNDSFDRKQERKAEKLRKENAPKNIEEAILRLFAMFTSAKAFRIYKNGNVEPLGTNGGSELVSFNETISRHSLQFSYDLPISVMRILESIPFNDVVVYDGRKNILHEATPIVSLKGDHVTVIHKKYEGSVKL